MNRRGFLSLLGLGSAGIALDAAIPFNRVWSFPSKIVVPKIVVPKIAEYCDYVSISDMLLLPAIDLPAVWYGYRLAGGLVTKDNVEKLKAMTSFKKLHKVRPLPKRTGNEMRLFTYNLYA